MIPQWQPVISWRDVLAVARCLRSGWIGTGPRVEELESRICEISGANYCVTTASGTTALMLALWSLELWPHSRIAFPDYGLPAGANAAKLLGHGVRLVDVDPKTLCMKSSDLAKFAANDLNAVICVDQNGRTLTEIGNVRQLCNDRGWPLIEDACQAFGQRYAGTIGDVGCYSFSVPKIVTGGHGGAVVTNSPIINKRLRQYQEHGGGDWKRSRVHAAVGGNFRMTDIQAALILSQLDRLPRLLKKRERIHNWYGEGGIPVAPASCYATTGGGEACAAFLRSRGVGAIVYYRPVHESLPYLADRRKFPGACAAAETVYLPSWLGLTRHDVRRVCEAVAEWRESHGYY